MRYKITKIMSRRLLAGRALLVACAMMYALCFALSVSYADAAMPEWMMLTHISK